MNHLGEVEIKLGDKIYNIKFTNKALFKVQHELKIKGLAELFNRIEQLDLLAIFTLLRHGLNVEKSVDQLMDYDLSLQDIAVKLAEALTAALGTPDQDK